MKILTVATILASLSLANAEIDMSKFKKEVTSENVLVVVSKYVKENPEEITALVKEAIIQTDASVEEVAKIVEAAINASPDNARLIYVAALSVAPDAHESVMKVYNKYVVNAGGYGDAKGGLGNKGNKDGNERGGGGQPAQTPNPLDLPQGTVGPADGVVAGGGAGGPGALGLLPFGVDPTTILTAPVTTPAPTPVPDPVTAF